MWYDRSVFVSSVNTSFMLLCFKQKTAYEMRISDWSSDVCSSDLSFLHKLAHDERFANPWRRMKVQHCASGSPFLNFQPSPNSLKLFSPADSWEEIGRASCRVRVCQYV